MTRKRYPIVKAAPLLLCAALLLSGCQSLLREGTADAAGIGGAALSTAVTDNGAVAAGIGLGVRSVAQAGLQYAERRAQRAEQDIIAKAAGPLPVGAVTPWGIRQNVPITPSHRGMVTVVRDMGAKGLECREIVFSVDRDAREKEVPDRAFYTAAICRNGQVWKWASAEPATERWGALQ
ncbi:MAG: hypothetical protein JWP20_1384 [Roseomonas sp.]|nr:hypothetical protein [Roseomonas sp.]